MQDHKPSDSADPDDQRITLLPPKFWVDAICIDQTNSGERNHQVQMMGDIYHNVPVLAWLGRNPAGSNTSSYRSGNARFCSNPYWKRLWIIQEVLLSNSLIICYGDECIDLYEARLARGKCGTRCDLTGHDIIQSLCEIATAPVHGKGLNKRLENYPTLTRLVARFGMNDCSVAHDKVYGLLAAANQYAPVDIVVDYNRELQDVYKDAVAAILREPDQAMEFVLLAVRRLGRSMIFKPGQVQQYVEEVVAQIGFEAHYDILRYRKSLLWKEAGGRVKDD